MKKEWLISGNSYIPTETSHIVPVLPKGVYKIELNPRTMELYLDKTQDEFHLPKKIYNLERPFINRCKTSWDNTTGNMGILLNGLRGTGKSVTAEILANELGLPVILITQMRDGMITFLNNIQGDIIVFIDEYDKIFNRYDNTLLSIMDGALKTEYRIMFLLTSNDVMLEKNMIQRPGRIRYIKSFGDLTLDVIHEVVDDMLIHTELRDEVIDFISDLEIITMDLVRAIVQETNIHHESPKAFEDVFNVTDQTREKFDIYLLNDGVKTKCKTASISGAYYPFKVTDVGLDIYADGYELGEIVQVLNASQLVVAKTKYGSELGDEEKVEYATYIFDKVKKKHGAFLNPLTF